MQPLAIKPSPGLCWVLRPEVEGPPDLSAPPKAGGTYPTLVEEQLAQMVGRETDLTRGRSRVGATHDGLDCDQSADLAQLHGIGRPRNEQLALQRAA